MRHLFLPNCILKMTISMIIFLSPFVAFSKPFWTEKSSYTEGDRIYFVGISSDQKTIETGRVKAFNAAKEEAMNYLQVIHLKGLNFRTQMTFEEKLESGKFNVYRLMFVNQEEVSKLKTDLAQTEQETAKRNLEAIEKEIVKKEALIKKAIEKEKELESKNSELKDIQNRIDELSEKSIKSLKCGMTLLEAKKIMSKPRAIGSYKLGSSISLDCVNYGKYWYFFSHGVLTSYEESSRYSTCTPSFSGNCPN